MPAFDTPDRGGSLTVAKLRSSANRFFQVASCVLVVVCTTVAWIGGQNIPVVFMMTSLAALIAFGGIAAYGTSLAGRLLVTLSCDMQIVTLIFAASNLHAAFVEEAHTMYGVLNLYLLAYVCWRSLLFYNSFIIAHHLLITYLMPRTLWGDAAAWEGLYHTSAHSLLATVLAASFMYTAGQIKRTLRSNEEALIRAAEAMEEARARARQAEGKQHEAERMALLVEEAAGGIEGQLRSLFETIFGAAMDVGRSAMSVATISRTGNDKTGEVEVLLQKTASNIDGVSRSVDGLARSVDEMAGRAEAAALAAQSAVIESAQAAHLVEALDASSRRIDDITLIIRAIADTINLLSLNATIEAARVGDAGHSFVTVAHNVKALAAETDKATEEIAGVVKTIQHETRGAMLAIATVGETIRSAHDHASGIALSIEQQKQMTASIVETASTIATETSEIRTQLTATMTLLVSANTMSDDLLDASGSLRHMAETSNKECVSLLACLRQA